MRSVLLSFYVLLSLAIVALVVVISSMVLMLMVTIGGRWTRTVGSGRFSVKMFYY